MRLSAAQELAGFLKEADDQQLDSRQFPDPTEPRPSRAPSGKDCTCPLGLKLECPVHGLHAPVRDDDMSWSIPEGSPIGWTQESPRSWQGPYSSINGRRLASLNVESRAKIAAESLSGGVERWDWKANPEGAESTTLQGQTPFVVADGKVHVGEPGELHDDLYLRTPELRISQQRQYQRSLRGEAINPHERGLIVGPKVRWYNGPSPGNHALLESIVGPKEIKEPEASPWDFDPGRHDDPDRFSSKTAIKQPLRVQHHDWDATNFMGEVGGYERRWPTIYNINRNTLHVGPEGGTHNDLAEFVPPPRGGHHQGWLGPNPEWDSGLKPSVIDQGKSSEYGWYNGSPGPEVDAQMVNLGLRLRPESWDFGDKVSAIPGARHAKTSAHRPFIDPMTCSHCGSYQMGEPAQNGSKYYQQCLDCKRTRIVPSTHPVIKALNDPLQTPYPALLDQAGDPRPLWLGSAKSAAYEPSEAEGYSPYEIEMYNRLREQPDQWRPGTQGKAVVTPEGKLYRWSVEPAEPGVPKWLYGPHHGMVADGHLAPVDSLKADIYPNGVAEVFNHSPLTMYLPHPLTKPKDQWNFDPDPRGPEGGGDIDLGLRADDDEGGSRWVKRVGAHEPEEDGWKWVYRHDLKDGAFDHAADTFHDNLDMELEERHPPLALAGERGVQAPPSHMGVTRPDGGTEVFWGDPETVMPWIKQNVHPDAHYVEGYDFGNRMASVNKEAGDIHQPDEDEDYGDESNHKHESPQHFEGSREDQGCQANDQKDGQDDAGGTLRHGLQLHSDEGHDPADDHTDHDAGLDRGAKEHPGGRQDDEGDEEVQQGGEHGWLLDEMEVDGDTVTRAALGSRRKSPDLPRAGWRIGSGLDPKRRRRLHQEDGEVRSVAALLGRQHDGHLAGLLDDAAMDGLDDGVPPVVADDQAVDLAGGMSGPKAVVPGRRGDGEDEIGHGWLLEEARDGGPSEREGQVDQMDEEGYGHDGLQTWEDDGGWRLSKIADGGWTIKSWDADDDDAIDVNRLFDRFEGYPEPLREQLYHRAPTSERARIMRHGLIPSAPGWSKNWNWRGRDPLELDRPNESIASQPIGVYMAPENALPDNSAMSHGQQQDTWAIDPRELAQNHVLQRDPIWTGAHYTDQPIPPSALRLHQRPEDQVPETDWDWGRDEDLNNQLDRLDQNRQRWQIGQPGPSLQPWASKRLGLDPERGGGDGLDLVAEEVGPLRPEDCYDVRPGPLDRVQTNALADGTIGRAVDEVPQHDQLVGGLVRSVDYDLGGGKRHGAPSIGDRGQRIAAWTIRRKPQEPAQPGGPWRPGSPGKCMMGPDGQVHSWATAFNPSWPDDIGLSEPTHMEGAQSRGLLEPGQAAPRAHGWIHPDGRLEFPYDEPGLPEHEQVARSISGTRLASIAGWRIGGLRTASMDWQPGSWGKGLIVGEQLHTWPTTKGGDPAHYDKLDEIYGNRRGDGDYRSPRDFEAPIVIHPSGLYTSDEVDVDPQRASRFAQADRGLKYVRSAGDWARKTGSTRSPLHDPLSSPLPRSLPQARATAPYLGTDPDLHRSGSQKAGLPRRSAYARPVVHELARTPSPDGWTLEIPEAHGQRPQEHQDHSSDQQGYAWIIHQIPEPIVLSGPRAASEAMGEEDGQGDSRGHQEQQDADERVGPRDVVGPGLLLRRAGREARARQIIGVHGGLLGVGAERSTGRTDVAAEAAAGLRAHAWTIAEGSSGRKSSVIRNEGSPLGRSIVHPEIGKWNLEPVLLKSSGSHPSDPQIKWYGEPGYRADHSILYEPDTDVLHVGDPSYHHRGLYEESGLSPSPRFGSDPIPMAVYDGKFETYRPSLLATPEGEARYQRLYGLFDRMHQEAGGGHLVPGSTSEGFFSFSSVRSGGSPIDGLDAHIQRRLGPEALNPEHYEDSPWHAHMEQYPTVESLPLPPHVFRAMSENHYQQSLRDGMHSSDGRNNYPAQAQAVDDWYGDAEPEGTVAGRWAYPGYLPLDGPGRVVKIRVDPRDGWENHPDNEEGGYVRTFSPIPTDRFEAATDPISRAGSNWRIGSSAYRGPMGSPGGWVLLSGETAAQRLRRAQELEAEVGPDQSTVEHSWPDGWSVRRLGTYGDLHREGTLMGNCLAFSHRDFQKEGEDEGGYGLYRHLPTGEVHLEDSSYVPSQHEAWGAHDGANPMPFDQPLHGDFYSLRDPKNLPHVSYDPDYQGEILGRHNDIPKTEHLHRMADWGDATGRENALDWRQWAGPRQSFGSHISGSVEVPWVAKSYSAPKPSWEGGPYRPLVIDPHKRTVHIGWPGGAHGEVMEQGGLTRRPALGFGYTDDNARRILLETPNPRASFDPIRAIDPETIRGAVSDHLGGAYALAPSGWHFGSSRKLSAVKVIHGQTPAEESYWADQGGENSTVPDHEGVRPVIHDPRSDHLYIGQEGTHHSDLVDEFGLHDADEPLWHEDWTSPNLHQDGELDARGLNYGLINPVYHQNGAVIGHWLDDLGGELRGHPGVAQALREQGVEPHPPGQEGWSFSKVRASSWDEDPYSDGWSPPVPQDPDYRLLGSHGDFEVHAPVDFDRAWHRGEEPQRVPFWMAQDAERAGGYKTFLGHPGMHHEMIWLPPGHGRVAAGAIKPAGYGQIGYGGKRHFDRPTVEHFNTFDTPGWFPRWDEYDHYGEQGPELEARMHNWGEFERQREDNNVRAIKNALPDMGWRDDAREPEGWNFSSLRNFSKVAGVDHHHNPWTGRPCVCPWGGSPSHLSKTAGANLNRVLKAPDKAFRTPEGQAFREQLAKEVGDQYDSLAPYIAQRWKRGEITHDPEDGIGGNLWHTDGYYNLRLEPALPSWHQFVEARQHPLRRGVNIMDPDFSVLRMREAVDRHKAALLEEKDLERAKELGTTVHSWPDKWHVKQLDSREAMEHEGQMMDHCLGTSENPDYRGLMEGGDISAYSLRDPQGRPHATWHTNNNQGGIADVFGRSDSTLKPEYQSRYEDWARKNGYDPEPVGHQEEGDVPEDAEVYLPPASDMTSYLDLHHDDGDSSEYYPDDANIGEDTNVWTSPPELDQVAADVLSPERQRGREWGHVADPANPPYGRRVRTPEETRREVFKTALQEGHLPELMQHMHDQQDPNDPAHQQIMQEWERYMQPHIHPLTGELETPTFMPGRGYVPIAEQYQGQLFRPAVRDQWTAPNWNPPASTGDLDNPWTIPNYDQEHLGAIRPWTVQQYEDPDADINAPDPRADRAMLIDHPTRTIHLGWPDSLHDQIWENGGEGQRGWTNENDGTISMPSWENLERRGVAAAVSNHLGRPYMPEEDPWNFEGRIAARPQPWTVKAYEPPSPTAFSGDPYGSRAILYDPQRRLVHLGWPNSFHDAIWQQGARGRHAWTSQGAIKFPGDRAPAEGRGIADALTRHLGEPYSFESAEDPEDWGFESRLSWGLGRPIVQKGLRLNREGAEQDRTRHWDDAYMRGADPYAPGILWHGMRTDADYVKRINDQMWRAWERGGRGQYTPEMDAAWHQDYQQRQQAKFVYDPAATPGQYEHWLDWYSQYAPQHLDPEGFAANQEPWSVLDAAPVEPSERLGGARTGHPSPWRLSGPQEGSYGPLGTQVIHGRRTFEDTLWPEAGRSNSQRPVIYHPDEDRLYVGQGGTHHSDVVDEFGLHGSVPFDRWDWIGGGTGAGPPPRMQSPLLYGLIQKDGSFEDHSDGGISEHPGASATLRQMGVQVEPPTPDDWNFSSVRTSHQLWWRPGVAGRGQVLDDGAVHTWPEAEGTHFEHAYHMNVNPVFNFHIRPDGTVGRAYNEEEPDSETVDLVQGVDPRLRVDPKLRPDFGFGFTRGAKLAAIQAQLSGDPRLAERALMAERPVVFDPMTKDLLVGHPGLHHAHLLPDLKGEGWGHMHTGLLSREMPGQVEWFGNPPPYEHQAEIEQALTRHVGRPIRFRDLGQDSWDFGPSTQVSPTSGPVGTGGPQEHGEVQFGGDSYGVPTVSA